MSVSDKQLQVLALFQHLEFVSKKEKTYDNRLRGLGILPRGVPFSVFNEKQTDEAQELFKVLFEAPTFRDFLHLARQARSLVNESLFAYSLSIALMHRPDCRGIAIPSIQETFPDHFVPFETINAAIRADLKRTDDEPIILDIFQTGNLFDPEFRLAYFREDFQANSHHWKWHIVYPYTWDPEVTGKVKDRKGELFAYMHQQMCARYDCDRLSCGLPRVIPFHNFEEPIDGYSSHLTLLSGKGYRNRPAGLSLKDVKGSADVQDLNRWRERILTAIDLGAVIDKHRKDVVLTPEKGMDILGAIVEASYESVNPALYGNFHNLTHDLISLIHDPDGRHKEYLTVVGDTSATLRDPIFFRLHRHIDDIFEKFRTSLPAYEKKELDFPGVRIVDVTLDAEEPNRVNTFMKEDLLELSHALPLKGQVKVRYHHLDHESFHYNINYENYTGVSKEATVRIFLAPVHDELGDEFSLEEARRYFIELDKFHTKLTPGKNIITRQSRDSAVTIHNSPLFSSILSGQFAAENNDDYCGCGWPDNLLVPRGNHKGMSFHLFVMLTDYELDKVEGVTNKHVCADASSYCGVKDEKYPDKRAMGFPFDRAIKGLDISDFKTPNMIFHRIKIQFKE